MPAILAQHYMFKLVLLLTINVSFTMVMVLYSLRGLEVWSNSTKTQQSGHAPNSGPEIKNGRKYSLKLRAGEAQMRDNPEWSELDHVEASAGAAERICYRFLEACEASTELEHAWARWIDWRKAKLIISLYTLCSYGNTIVTACTNLMHRL